MAGKRQIKDDRLAVAHRVRAIYLYRAKKTLLYWELTVADLMRLIYQNCTYCGSPPKNEWHMRRGVFYTGVDRKNNGQGYTVTNTVPCCHTCNSIKGMHLTFDEMHAAMQAVVKLREERAQSQPRKARTK